MVQVQGLPFRDEFRDKGLGLGVQGSRCAVLSDLGLGAELCLLTTNYGLREADAHPTCYILAGAFLAGCTRFRVEILEFRVTECSCTSFPNGPIYYPYINETLLQVQATSLNPEPSTTPKHRLKHPKLQKI